jgi:uncharacterized protein (TIGR03083 family)
MDTAAIHQAIRDLDRAFVADMEALPAEIWQQPSDCDGWTIASAVIHLAQVAEFLADSLARGRAGDPGPPPLAVSDGIPAWRAVRAARLAEALKQSPRELLDWYRQASATIDAEIGQIPSAPPDARGWHPVGANPLPWIQDQWLFELALHDWDIRVALDPAADVRPSAQGAFARTLPGRLGRGFGGGDDPALAGVYRIELAAEPPLTFAVRVGDGKFATTDSDAIPVATIRSDPSAFALVTTNRRPVDRFEADGRWQVAGDETRARGFARAFGSF